MDKETKNQKMIIILLSIIIVILLALCIYFVFIKKDKNETSISNSQTQTNDNQKDTLLSNAEALTIAKKKLSEAQDLYNELNDYYKKYTGNDKYGDLYYYSTKDDITNKFYTIFSSNLSLKDIFAERSITDNNYYSTNVKGNPEGLINYAVKDNKFYLKSSCGIGSSSTPIYGEFKVEKIENNLIKITHQEPFLAYEDYISDDEDNLENKTEYQNYLSGLNTMTLELVKENNNWKINKAVILDVCPGSLEINQ